MEQRMSSKNGPIGGVSQVKPSQTLCFSSSCASPPPREVTLGCATCFAIRKQLNNLTVTKFLTTTFRPHRVSPLNLRSLQPTFFKSTCWVVTSSVMEHYRLLLNLQPFVATNLVASAELILPGIDYHPYQHSFTLNPARTSPTNPAQDWRPP